MNTINRVLKFLAFYSLNQLPFFRGMSKILNSVERYLVFSTQFGAIDREPTGGLLHKNNEEAVPHPPGTDRLKQFHTPETEGLDLSQGCPRGWLQVKLNHA